VTAAFDGRQRWRRGELAKGAAATVRCRARRRAAGVNRRDVRRSAEAEVVAARGPIPPPPAPCGRRVERRQLRASVRDGEREARAAGSVFRDQACLWALDWDDFFSSWAAILGMPRHIWPTYWVRPCRRTSKSPGAGGVRNHPCP